MGGRAQTIRRLLWTKTLLELTEGRGGGVRIRYLLYFFFPSHLVIAVSDNGREQFLFTAFYTGENGRFNIIILTICFRT